MKKSSLKNVVMIAIAIITTINVNAQGGTLVEGGNTGTLDAATVKSAWVTGTGLNLNHKDAVYAVYDLCEAEVLRDGTSIKEVFGTKNKEEVYTLWANSLNTDSLIEYQGVIQTMMATKDGKAEQFPRDARRTGDVVNSTGGKTYTLRANEKFMVSTYFPDRTAVSVLCGNLALQHDYTPPVTAKSSGGAASSTTTTVVTDYPATQPIQNRVETSAAYSVGWSANAGYQAFPSNCFGCGYGQMGFSFNPIDSYNRNRWGSGWQNGGGSGSNSNSNVNTNDIDINIDNDYETPLWGCTDPLACNFSPTANSDNGSCYYDCNDVYGCVEQNACNYNPEATINDGSCYYAQQGYDCFGDCLAPGCTDSSACNYNPNAVCGDNSLCTYVQNDCQDCVNGNIVSLIAVCGDEDACNYQTGNCVDNNLCNYDCYGCTDQNACNFNATATIDDGSCEFDSCTGCTDVNACNYNPDVTLDDGSCIIPGDSCNDGDPETINDQINSDCDCEGEIEAVPGCTDNLACNYNPDATIDDGSCILIGDSCDDGNADTENDILDSECNCVGELVVPGCTDNLACNYNPDATIDDGSCILIGDSCDDGNADTENDILDSECNCVGELVVPGCTDNLACNYNPDATIDDGSCILIGDSCDDGNADTENDILDSECNCVGELVVPGCTDNLACNYNPDATIDDGSCILIGDSCDDGNADTENDILDSECNCVGELVVEDVLGCTDISACNYDSTATLDDDSCTFATDCIDCEGNPIGVQGCTDSSANNYDPTANCDDGSCEYGVEEDVPGCTDSNADNYNPDATIDDGSCSYVDEDEIVEGCTCPCASNFNPGASVDDGSCDVYDWDGDCENLGGLITPEQNTTESVSKDIPNVFVPAVERAPASQKPVIFDGSSAVKPTSFTELVRENKPVSQSVKPVLEDGKPMTFEQMAQAVESRPLTQSRVNPQARPSTKPSTKPSSRNNVKPQTQSRVNPQARPSTKPSTKPSSRNNVKPQTQSRVNPQARPSTKPSTKPSSRNNVKPQVQVDKGKGSNSTSKGSSTTSRSKKRSKR